MRRLATALSLLALAAAPAAEAQFTDSSPITTNFTTTGTNERGIAYGVVGSSERLYMTSRNGGVFAYIYDADTGVFQSTAGDGAGSLNTAGISGGFLALNDVEVSGDGHVYGCNLSLSNVAGGNEFKCYHWASEASAPAPVTFTGLPVLAGLRLGDRVRVTGSLASGLHMWLVAPAIASPAQVPQLYRCSASDYTTFACTAHDLGSVSVSSISNGSASPNPGSTTSIWLNGNGALPRLVTIPAAVDGAATLVTNIPSAQLGGAACPSSNCTGNNSIYAFTNEAGDSTYVAIFEYRTGAASGYNRGRIVNVTPIVASGTSTGVYSWGVTTSSGDNTSSGAGDIAFRIKPAAGKAAALPTVQLFVLRQNQNLGVFETNKAGLPVELVNFAGVANGSTARLSWQTVSETNNLGFTVERLQGNNWSDASSLINGHGTTTEVHAYTFDVNGLAPGNHTFRLRQTDTDGSLHYSNNVTVEIALDATHAVTLLGNRAVRVSVQEPQAVTVRVYDVLGRSVATLRTGDLSGTEDVLLPGGLASGSYLVRVEGERFAATKNLVVR